MKKRYLYFVVAVVLGIAVSAYVWHRRTLQKDGEHVEPSKVEQATSETPPQSETTESQVPPTAIPVEAARRLAVEQKWASRNNGPVQFYAKVIDQNGQPVEGAILTMTLSVFDEGVFVSDKNRVKTTKLRIVSGAGGLLEIKNSKGSSLWVESLEKEGYLWVYPQGLGSFSFGSLHAPKVAPDYANPSRRFIFHMWKKGASEQVISQSFRISIGGGRSDETKLNLIAGKAGVFPDLVIKTPHVSDQSRAEKGEREFIFEVPSGGISETQDVYPYAAPLDGYQTKWQWLFQPAQTPREAEGWQRNFYVKTRNGKVYASLHVVFDFSGPAFVIENNCKSSRISNS